MSHGQREHGMFLHRLVHVCTGSNESRNHRSLVIVTQVLVQNETEQRCPAKRKVGVAIAELREHPFEIIVRPFRRRDHELLECEDESASLQVGVRPVLAPRRKQIFAHLRRATVFEKTLNETVKVQLSRWSAVQHHSEYFRSVHQNHNLSKGQHALRGDVWEKLHNCTWKRSIVSERQTCLVCPEDEMIHYFDPSMQFRTHCMRIPYALYENSQEVVPIQK
mmetsp:Transcript_13128/g.43234  ORF Transcript_13128/g.43234 Transcript_13128/m.43234 type:complete len:221 (+) Transcript_13128:1950-2612(+)